MRLATNLLRAASNIAELRQELRHADVVQELVGLAFQQTRFNDSQSTAQGFYGETLERGLDLLTNQTLGNAPRDTQAALAQGFKYLTTTEQKLQLLRLVGNLLEVAPQVPGMKSADSGLIAMATAYLALNPTGTMAADDPLKFLETLTQSRTPALIQQGVTQLQAFLAGATTEPERQRLMQMGVKTLQAAKQVQLTSDRPELRQQMSDVGMLNQLVGLGVAYAALNSPEETPLQGDISFFLHTLWQGTNETSILKGAVELTHFIEGFENPIQLIEYQRKFFTALGIIPIYQEALRDPFFAKNIAALGKDYVSIKTNHPEVEEIDDFLHQVWQANTIAQLRYVANQLQIPSQGRFTDEKLNLYDFLAHGVESPDELEDKGKAISLYNYNRIRRPHDVTVTTQNMTLSLADTDKNDGDAVTVYHNGKLLGWYGLSTTGLSIPIKLQPGTNTISIRSISEGFAEGNRATTLAVIIPSQELDRNDPRNKNRRGQNYMMRTNLTLGTSVDITVGLPQVPVDARRYPDIGRHTVDSWNYGYPRILTIDRYGQLGGFTSKEQRRTASINRYLRDPNNPDYNPQLEDLDEYPPAMFLENYGRAHVRPINSSQNRGAGSKMDFFLTHYKNGEQIEMITNYSNTSPF
jgi:hypothetical protein